MLSSESKQPSQQSAVKSERPRSHSCPTSYHPTAHSTPSTVLPEYQARSDIPGGRGRLKTNHKALVLRAEASDRYIQLGATRGWLAGRADRSVPRSRSRSKVRRAPDRLQQRANCRYHGMEQRAGRGSLVQSAERTADECRYAEERPERNERAGRRERAKPIRSRCPHAKGAPILGFRGGVRRRLGTLRMPIPQQHAKPISRSCGQQSDTPGTRCAAWDQHPKPLSPGSRVRREPDTIATGTCHRVLPRARLSTSAMCSVHIRGTQRKRRAAGDALGFC